MFVLFSLFLIFSIFAVLLVCCLRCVAEAEHAPIEPSATITRPQQQRQQQQQQQLPTFDRNCNNNDGIHSTSQQQETVRSCKKNERVVLGHILLDESDSSDHLATNETETESAQPKGVLFADFGDNEVILPIEELSCSICLVEYRHGDRIQRNGYAGGCGNNDLSTMMPCAAATMEEQHHRCDHIFHPECITNWIQQQNHTNEECPICRRPFLVERKPHPLR